MAPLAVILTAGGWAALSWLLAIAASLALLRLPWGRRIEAGELMEVIRVAGTRIVGRRTRLPRVQECVMSTRTFVNHAATTLVVAGGLYGRTAFSP